jgi:hypothetical protein
MANGTIAVSSVEILSQSGTGVITVNPPATNTNRTITLPDGTGTVAVNGVNGVLVSATSQASTSGTSIDFTGIPSWVKRITVMLDGVSTSGTSPLRFQIGDSGGIEITGYSGMALRSVSGGSVGTSTFTVGYDSFGVSVAASSYSGHFILTNISGNIWVASANIGVANASTMNTITGTKTLSDVLDSVRITTVNGTDTFDAGTINILYE